MSIALDIGTSRLRSLHRVGDEVVGRSVPASFALIADEPAARSLLSRANLAFASGDGELALFGAAALRHAGTFRASCERLLHDGRVPTDDPPARELLAALVESLLPLPRRRGEPCGLVMTPAAMFDRDSRSFLTRLANARGYEALTLTPSLALMLASFSTENFSGVGMTFGAGGCSISLVHRGRELLHVAEARGTDWVDRELALRGDVCTHDELGRRYLDLDTVRRRREQLDAPASETDFGREVTRLYEEVLTAAWERFSETLAAERRGPYALEASVICGGGGTQASGFDVINRRAIENASLPVPLGPFRVAPADDYLMARGALIHAEIERAIGAAA